MSNFHCVPVPSETAARWRQTGTDDNGNVLRRMPSDGTAPCRHCLQRGKPGEEMLLGSYNLPGPLGIYWTPSPIFVHAEACLYYAASNEVPEIVARNAMVSVRAYDRDDQCIYDLGHAGSGDAVDPFLLRAIFDPRTKFVNIHTAKPGCMLCRVERG